MAFSMRSVVDFFRARSMKQIYKSGDSNNVERNAEVKGSTFCDLFNFAILLEDVERVRRGDCRFTVKYFGSIIIDEPREEICGAAFLHLSQKKQRKVKAILSVSPDGLRLIGDRINGLIMDQPLDKVIFCTNDSCGERGFVFVSRDGTAQTWVCHAFEAKDCCGDRAIHAVGAAFRFANSKQRSEIKRVMQLSSGGDSPLNRRQSVPISVRLRDPQKALPLQPIKRAAKVKSLVLTPGSFRPRPKSSYSKTFQENAILDAVKTLSS